MATVDTAACTTNLSACGAGAWRYGLIGGGNMATAIMRGVLEGAFATQQDFVICEKLLQRRQALHATFAAVALTTDLAATARASTKLVLAVKPQDATGVLQTMAPELTREHVLISIVAGLSCPSIRALVGPNPDIIRVMPNLPLAVGAGMNVYCYEAGVEGRHLQLLEQMFGTKNKLLALPEAQFDAVTALSGSGPGFVAYFMQAFYAMAHELGLAQEVIPHLVQQTFIGAALYLRQTKQSPDAFVQQVCSPNGTTEAGIKVLAQADCQGTIRAALLAAATRSRQLSSTIN